MKVIGKVEKLIDHNKWRAAFLAPFGVSLIGVAERYVQTGVWDGAQTRIIVGGAASAVLSAVATYLVPAGKAVVTVAKMVPPGPETPPAATVPTVPPPDPTDDGNDGDDIMDPTLKSATVVENPAPDSDSQSALEVN